MIPCFTTNTKFKAFYEAVFILSNLYVYTNKGYGISGIIEKNQILKMTKNNSKLILDYYNVIFQDNEGNQNFLL